MSLGGNHHFWPEYNWRPLFMGDPQILVGKYGSLQRGGSPMKIWGSPMKIWGSPMKIGGSTTRIWQFQTKIWGLLIKILRSPM